MAIRNVDYTGRVYGDFKVLGRGNIKDHWVFECKCGKILTRSIYAVVSEKRYWCNNHQGSLRSRNKSTHASWAGMISRCTNPKNASYESYGGRGITVCEEWLTFEGFLADMGAKPAGLTLERINVNIGYSKQNCSWVTPADQNRNKQYHKMVTYGGATKPLFRWVGELGLNYYTVHSRLYKGCTAEEALFGTRPRKSKGNSRHERHKNDLMSLMPHGGNWYSREMLAQQSGKDRETVRETTAMLVAEGVLDEVTIQNKKWFSRK